MEKILVTGGSGFIGINLVNQLKSHYNILNIDKFPPADSTLNSYWRKIDILDYENLERELLDFDPEFIVHLAAVTDLNGTDSLYYSANVEGTQNIIRAANRLKNLRKIIFTSSMYVCRPGFIPKAYDDYKPHTTYGESKVKGELLVKEIRNSQYKWVIIRPTSIWGPWFGIPYIDFFNIVYSQKYFDFSRTCTKTYGFVENTIFQIEKLLHSDLADFKTLYLGDTPAIKISEWANQISLEFGNGPIKKIPFFLIKSAAFLGDTLIKLSIKFPISSFRLSNMTTNNILPLDEINKITVEPPISRAEGTRKTIDWLVSHKGYSRNRK
jgi:GlcNAc-P-P-Und epimerase